MVWLIVSAFQLSIYVLYTLTTFETYVKMYYLVFCAVDTPLSESRFADMLEGWVDEEREVHDDHANPNSQEHEDDHDEEHDHDEPDDNNELANSQEHLDNNGTFYSESSNYYKSYFYIFL